MPFRIESSIDSCMINDVWWWRAWKWKKKFQSYKKQQQRQHCTFVICLDLFDFCFLFIVFFRRQNYDWLIVQMRQWARIFIVCYVCVCVCVQQPLSRNKQIAIDQRIRFFIFAKQYNYYIYINLHIKCQSSDWQ